MELFKTPLAPSITLVKDNSETAANEIVLLKHAAAKGTVAELFKQEKLTPETIATSTIDPRNLSVLDDLFADAINTLNALND
jgi:hypothetical protein